MVAIFVIASIIGTIRNANMKRDGFLFWMFGNFGLIYQNLLIDQKEQAGMFALYLILSAYGWIKWGEKNG